jgi:hypothetical protein
MFIRVSDLSYDIEANSCPSAAGSVLSCRKIGSLSFVTNYQGFIIFSNQIRDSAKNVILNQLFQKRRHTLQTVSASRNIAAIIGR